MLKAERICKSFGAPAQQVLYDVSFEIQSGQFVSISGKSGSGKSTLLYIISTLDRPTSGDVIIDGSRFSTMTEQDIHRFRNSEMGFVFQFHYLLPEFTALENILMPARKAKKLNEKSNYAIELLERFGLGQKGNRFPKQLSGGEQQRVAIARALIMSPQYIFADEPTGNLDSVNSQNVMDILQQISQDFGTTVVYVTHDPDFADRAEKKIEIADGRIVTP